MQFESPWKQKIYYGIMNFHALQIFIFQIFKKKKVHKQIKTLIVFVFLKPFLPFAKRASRTMYSIEISACTFSDHFPIALYYLTTVSPPRVSFPLFKHIHVYCWNCNWPVERNSSLCKFLVLWDFTSISKTREYITCSKLNYV
jgi:hypothetical protein